MKRWFKDRDLVFRQLFLVVLDIFTVICASTMALWVRFDFSVAKIERMYLDQVWLCMIPNVLMALAVYWLFRMYRSVWKYASIYELKNIVFAGVTVTLLQLLGMTVVADLNMPRSYWFLFGGILVAGTTCTRFSYRLIRHMRNANRDKKSGVKRSRVMIIGAGNAGEMLIREIMASQYLHKEIGCVIDDNPVLKGNTIRGHRIVGGRESIVEAARQYQIDEIIIAMPSISKKQTAEIATLCNQTGCQIKIVPGMYQLVNEEVSVSKLRHVEIEDLLGREPVKVDMEKVTGFLKDQTVLVTGGGGSIGSELCRQIAAAQPKKLIIVDIYENNAYEIQQELKRKYPKLNLIVLIASVRNTNRMNKIFETYLPNVVFHAAAHKHVPLMEDSPNEAIKNNVFGTLKTVQAADKYGVERFVLISTDKAVNPTNIMGASKRICEMICRPTAAVPKPNLWRCALVTCLVATAVLFRCLNSR